MIDEYIQPSRFLLPQDAPARLAKKVAVVLNGNAKAVTESLIRDIRQVLRDEDLYVSRSLDQWRFIARRIVNRGYDVVVLGGGDGTFAQCVSDIMSLQPAREPAFGMLRLGTGNALANTLGSGKTSLQGFAGDLRRARSLDAQDRLPVLRVEGMLAPFSGVGLDSLILEDYNATKRALRNTPLARLGQGTAGYALAVATRSIRRFMFETWPEVIIRNEGAPTRRMDLHGQPIGPVVPRGGILYQGQAGIAACSTVPYYGLGLKLFPQVMRRRDRFQLRVATVDAISILTKLPAIFRGEYEDDRIHDFFCTEVSIQTSKPTPLQVGGDDVGRRSAVQVGLSQVRAVHNHDNREPTTVPSTLGTVIPLDSIRKTVGL